MTNSVLSRGTFFLVMMAAVCLVLSTAGSLPDPVATKFGGGGVPVSFMSRSGYVAFILSFLTLLPIFMVAMVGYLPRLFPGSINVPNRAYWLAPPRRAAVLDFLTSQGYWIASIMIAFLGGLHWLTVEANLMTPPRLSGDGILVLTVVFLASLGAWIGVLFARFRLPRAGVVGGGGVGGSISR